jgi:hypothetical protein
VHRHAVVCDTVSTHSALGCVKAHAALQQCCSSVVQLLHAYMWVLLNLARFRCRTLIDAALPCASMCMRTANTIAFSLWRRIQKACTVTCTVTCRFLLTSLQNGAPQILWQMANGPVQLDHSCLAFADVSRRACDASGQPMRC